MSTPKAPCYPNEKFKSQNFLALTPGRKGEGGQRTLGIFKNSLPQKPLITIITVSYNGKKYLEETIKSILEQSYSNFEYLVIDGGSTDDSLKIIEKYSDKIDYWVSEPDKGISHAFNKGVSLARGDYINFQGDGDGFIASNSLEELNLEQYKGAELVSARVNRVNEKGYIFFTSKHESCFHKKSLLFRMSCPHQGLFTSLNYFKSHGLFKLSSKFAMDYEILLRAYKNFPKLETSEQVIAKWRDDGLGKGRIRDVLNEYHAIKCENKVAHPFFLSCLNFWTHLKFSFKENLKALGIICISTLFLLIYLFFIK